MTEPIAILVWSNAHKMDVTTHADTQLKYSLSLQVNSLKSDTSNNFLKAAPLILTD